MTAVPVHRRGERGVALIELLITVSILGICSAALLAGLATVVRTSATHRDAADADVTLVSAAEAIKAADFAACGDAPTAYLEEARAHMTVPAGWTGVELRIVAVDCTSPVLQTVHLSVTPPRGATYPLAVAKGSRLATRAVG